MSNILEEALAYLDADRKRLLRQVERTGPHWRMSEREVFLRRMAVEIALSNPSHELTPSPPLSQC